MSASVTEPPPASTRTGQSGRCRASGAIRTTGTGR
jgi:hypothetical protein